MLDIAIMIEGQNGLTWPRWQNIARAAEDLGFAGLYRSDHFTNANPPDLDSLELWVSLTWLASHTRRLAFGPLVSPVSFRHPTLTARMACAVDDLSHGRLTLGLGAGWQAREHTLFGWELLDLPRRFRRFEEGLEVIQRLLTSDAPVSFHGEFYQLREATMLPRPQRPGGPPLLIGGNGEKRTLALAARYASEWNAVYLPPARFAALNQQLDQHLLARERDPRSVRRSLMTGLVFGATEADYARKLGQRDEAALRARGVLCGPPATLRPQLQALAEAGVQRLMLQWLDLDDLAGLEALAQAAQ
jgi:F420-dependent oxidoreductase-like protein